MTADDITFYGSIPDVKMEYKPWRLKVEGNLFIVSRILWMIAQDEAGREDKVKK